MGNHTDPIAKLEEQYHDRHIPVYDEESGMWCVQTGRRFECGDLVYVAGEFSGMGLIYHYINDGKVDHEHYFTAVLEAVLRDPVHIDIVTDYGEYSDQQIRMIEGIKRAAEFVHTYHRPMTNVELKKNRECL